MILKVQDVNACGLKFGHNTLTPFHEDVPGLVCWNEALSARSDHGMAAGHRITGITVVLEEMDVARAKPKTPATSDASLQPAAAAYCPAGNPRPPLSRWTTSTRPGARRALGMGDDVWRGQTDGSVEDLILYAIIQCKETHSIRPVFLASTTVRQQWAPGCHTSHEHYPSPACISAVCL